MEASAPLVDTSTASLGSVVNERSVQEIPLNGRHFPPLDLAQLTTRNGDGARDWLNHDIAAARPEAFSFVVGRGQGRHREFHG